MDRFKCLQAFITAADVGGISHAARALGVSKSVVSERITQLEELLDQSLLHRARRRTVLTDVGAELYPVYADLVMRLSELPNTLPRGRNQLIGRLRVASIIDTGMTELSSLLSGFSHDNPDIRLELFLGNNVVNPIEEGFDLALHYRPLRNHALHQETVAELPCGLYASPHYLKKRAPPRSPADLLSHRCLGYAFQPGVADWNQSLWSFRRNGRDHQVQVDLTARFNSGHALRRFVLDGQGLAVLPCVRVAADLKTGRVQAVLEDFAPPALTLYMVFARVHQNSRKIHELLTILRDGYRKLVEANPGAIA